MLGLLDHNPIIKQGISVHLIDFQQHQCTSMGKEIEIEPLISL